MAFIGTLSRILIAVVFLAAGECATFLKMLFIFLKRAYLLFTPLLSEGEDTLVPRVFCLYDMREDAVISHIEKEKDPGDEGRGGGSFPGHYVLNSCRRNKKSKYKPRANVLRLLIKPNLNCKQ